MDLEMRLRNGGLGGVDNFTDWEKNINKAKKIQEFVSNPFDTVKLQLTFLCLIIQNTRFVMIRVFCSPFILVEISRLVDHCKQF